MAIITRYFSTTAAGDGDGTSWANRAALFSDGNWSSAITGFDFSGSDSLECLIGPGTHNCGQILATSLFASAPTAANPLFLQGCDNSGDRLEPPDPDWTAAEPEWDASGLPNIATTGVNETVNTSMAGILAVRLVRFTATARNGIVASMRKAEWVACENSASNSSASGIACPDMMHCWGVCAGSAYANVFGATSNDATRYINCRMRGAAGSSGNRRGLSVAAFAPPLVMDGCCIVGVGGVGVFVSSQASLVTIARSVVANCGGNGIEISHSTAAMLNRTLNRMMVTGCGGFGATASNVTGLFVSRSRFRDNASGNINGSGNYPVQQNLTAAGTDADEFVDAAGGDYRIKRTSSLWGKGYGAGDEPVSGGSATHRIFRARYIQRGR